MFLNSYFGVLILNDYNNSRFACLKVGFVIIAFIDTVIMLVKEYEKILKDLKYKCGSQPNPETILKDLAVEIRVKNNAEKFVVEAEEKLVSKNARILNFIEIRRTFVREVNHCTQS